MYKSTVKIDLNVLSRWDINIIQRQTHHFNIGLLYFCLVNCRVVVSNLFDSRNTRILSGNNLARLSECGKLKWTERPYILFSGVSMEKMMLRSNHNHVRVSKWK